jgi:hypothetical protein
MDFHFARRPMFKSSKAVISVPANELRHAELPGSVFDADLLHQMPISEGLRRAYQLISMYCKTPLCIVRPEIFAHGKTRSWLDSKLGEARHHICVSDGTSVKVIDGLDNHVFFYGLGRRKNAESLQNLLAWAPEVFGQLQSQINTFHATELSGRLVQPPTTLSMPKAHLSSDAAELYPFLLYPQWLEESARLIVENSATVNSNLDDFSELIYIPFSETSTHDATFTRMVAQVVARAYFRPEQCVVLRLPMPSDSIPDLAQQIMVTLKAISASNIVVPRVSARNVFLVGSELPEAVFHRHERVSLLIDDTFEFWRYTRAFYTKLQSLRYVLGVCDRRRLQGVVRGLTAIVGRPPFGLGAASATPPVVLTWDLARAAAVQSS